MEWFRGAYPRLFADDKLIRHELGYKREASKKFAARFGAGRAATLLRNDQFDEIASGLDELSHATNIPSRFEIMAMHDGLRDRSAAARLMGSRLEFLENPGADSFSRLTDAVGSLPAPEGGSRVLTWPNVTILPFIADPSRFMVMKPQISKKMARRMSFDLLYSSDPTWHCYEALQRMSLALLEHLAPMGARDFIDIQSFIWVTQASISHPPFVLFALGRRFDCGPRTGCAVASLSDLRDLSEDPDLKIFNDPPVVQHGRG